MDGGADGGSGDGDAKGLSDFSHGEIVFLAELLDSIVQGLRGPVIQVGQSCAGLVQILRGVFFLEDFFNSLGIEFDFVGIKKAAFALDFGEGAGALVGS